MGQRKRDYFRHEQKVMFKIIFLSEYVERSKLKKRA